MEWRTFAAKTTGGVRRTRFDLHGEDAASRVRSTEAAAVFPDEARSPFLKSELAAERVEGTADSEIRLLF